MSTRTPNINLEKPSSDEHYSVSVFNGNSDTLDTEMALRVKTADIINNLTSTATNKPLSAAQGKVLSDGKVNVSDIQNNLTSTATNKPLSAAQGKALSDTIATVSHSEPYINSGTILAKLKTLIRAGNDINRWFTALSISDAPKSNEAYNISFYKTDGTGNIVVHADLCGGTQPETYIRNAFVNNDDTLTMWNGDWQKLITETRSSTTATVNKNLGTVGYNEVYRNGNVVYVNLRTYNTSIKNQINVTDAIFTLPEGFRPPSAVNVIASAVPNATQFTNDFTAVGEIRSDGTCHVVVSAQYYQVWITGCFVI